MPGDGPNERHFLPQYVLHFLVSMSGYYYCNNCGDGPYNIKLNPACPTCYATPNNTTLESATESYTQRSDGSYNATPKPTTRLRCCLYYTMLLIGFLVDGISAIDLGHHKWPAGLTTAVKTKCEPLGANTMCANHMVISTIAFFTASTAIYRLNAGDRCQDNFLLAGITSGVGLGFLLGGGLHSAILGFIPWTIILSFLCSIIYHRIVELTHCREPVLEEKAPLLG